MITDPAQIDFPAEFLGLIRDLKMDEDQQLRKLVDQVGLKEFIDKIGHKRVLDELLKDLNSEQREDLKRQL